MPVNFVLIQSYLGQVIIMMINTSVITPIAVEKSPKALDLVQPNKEMITEMEMIPIKNEILPMTFGKTKSLPCTSSGNPSVVIMKIFVIAKMEIRKAPVAKIENLNMFTVILSDSFLSNNNTSTVNEKPPSKALMNCI